jgi:peptide/nickel transport system substrate-binding protein
MINEEAFEHLDPQNIYVNNSQAIARLMFRALMGYHEDPSNGTFTLTPDLAAEMPTANADNTVWTFKIRTGVKYADGTAVTAADIKYGVERSMDPNIPYGPQYAKQYLVGAASYTGPSKGDLASIVVPDPQTIVFHLAQPVGTWAELCTLPTFIPVPKAKDTGKTYDLHPVCMGPYTIQTYTQATTLVLVPNTHWDKSTDPLRSQYFKEVNVKMNVNPNTVDEELFTDGQGGTLATFDAPQPANVAKAVTSEYSSRTYQALTAFVFYTQVSTKQKALQDQRVRQALVYARDPNAALKVAGGSLLNQVAHSLAPTFLKGFENAPNYYPDLGPDGNPAKAKQLLKEAGVTDLTVTTAYENLPASEKSIQVSVQAYARAGIKLVPKPISQNDYYTTISNPANHFDLYGGAWGYDIPDASTIYPPLFRGGTNIYNGSSNYAGTNIASLDATMAKALKLSPAAALPLWLSVNKYLITEAIAIPTFESKIVTMVGTKVRGAYISPVLGCLDISNAYISNT